MRAVTNVLAVARRELGSYFSSPVGYIITALVILVNSFVFLPTLSGGQASIGAIIQWMTTLLVFVGPILSMRLLAEEQKSGTLELLMTAPVRDSEVAIGKYLATLGFLGAILAFSLVYPAILYIFGQPDRGQMIGGYLAMLLFGATAMAIGLLASSLTQNQIVAAVIGIVVMLLLYFVDVVAQAASGTAATILNYISAYSHLSSMAQGVIDTKDVIYFLSLVLGALFLTTRSLEARRWRG